MRYLSILIILIGCYAACSAAATPPYDKLTVPWSVYVPTGPGDVTGLSDATISLHGDDVDGWYTFMVFKDNGAGSYTQITANADLYDGASQPIIIRSDYEGVASAINGYIIVKFILIQPATTPSKNIVASTYIDDGTKRISFGHLPADLAYSSVEEKIDNITLSGDYWMSANECPQKLWKIAYGDKLYAATLGSLKDDLTHFLSTNTDGAADNNNLALPNPVADYIQDEMSMHSATWTEIQTFFSGLTAYTGGKTARLPNEYEWEYGARAGLTTALPMAILSGDRSWKMVDPADDVTELSIAQVFDKKHHPKDIPQTLISENIGSKHVGNNPDGTKILANVITSLDWEIDPRLEATRDFRLVIDGEINYDKRYPGKFVRLKQLLKGTRGSLNGFMSVNDDGSEIDQKLFREYYDTIHDLARGVNGFYMPVDENGIYAATLTGGLYLYDDSKLHHFEKITGREKDPNLNDNIWPSSKDPAMTVDNTVLTYFHWAEYDTTAAYTGRPYFGSTYGNARSELIADVMATAFSNSPGDYTDNPGEIYVADKTTIKQDLGLKLRFVNQFMRISIGGSQSHKWYWTYNVYGGGTSGDGIRNFTTTDPNGDIPIDGIGGHEKPAIVTELTNDWGFANMNGNIAEYCIPVDETSDAARWDGQSNYAAYTNTGDKVVTRGGSWNTGVTGIRFSSRKAASIYTRSPENGFRILIEQ